ncbi:hypothetical protein ES703_114810 [subsurface metagenome]
MDARVVKFNALTNADRTTADDYCLIPLKRFSLILLLIGTIEVGSPSIKLSSTGIHHLINGTDLPIVTQLSYLFRKSVS